jgi:hypothetical protein
MLINCTEKCIFQKNGECVKDNCYIGQTSASSLPCVYSIRKLSAEAQTPNGPEQSQRLDTTS